MDLPLRIKAPLLGFGVVAPALHYAVGLSWRRSFGVPLQAIAFGIAFFNAASNESRNPITLAGSLAVLALNMHFVLDLNWTEFTQVSLGMSVFGVLSYVGMIGVYLLVIPKP